MKRIISFVLSCVIVCAFCFVDDFRVSVSAVSAKGYCLLNADTFEVLDAKNAHQRLPMASTTKLMTALILAEQNTPDRIVVTTKEMVTVEGSSMGLLQGDTVSFYDLLVGLMLPSGNDAANTVAIAVAGSVEAFAEMMNKRAKEIGMQNTHFVTPSGLDADGHYSTSYDMALLGAVVLKNPLIASVVKEKKISVTFGNPPYQRVLYNHNKLLDRYEYCIGLKTGFTKKSGRCLVSAAERDGCRVVCATLNAPDDWNDHINLLSKGLSQLKLTDVTTDLPIESVKVVGGEADSVNISAQSFECGCTENTKHIVKSKSYLQPFVYAPVSEGQRLGFIEYYCNDKLIGITYVVALSEVGKKIVKVSSSDNFKKCLEKLINCLI